MTSTVTVNTITSDTTGEKPIAIGDRVFVNLEAMQRDLDAVNSKTPYSPIAQMWRITLPMMIDTTVKDDVSGFVVAATDVPDLSFFVSFSVSDDRHEPFDLMVFPAVWLSLPPETYATGDRVRLDYAAIRGVIEMDELRGLASPWKDGVEATVLAELKRREYTHLQVRACCIDDSYIVSGQGAPYQFAEGNTAQESASMGLAFSVKGMFLLPAREQGIVRQDTPVPDAKSFSLSKDLHVLTDTGDIYEIAIDKQFILAALEEDNAIHLVRQRFATAWRLNLAARIDTTQARYAEIVSRFQEGSVTE